jgi:urocanate hydratase
MGGAQPLAATMNEGTFLGADVDRARIQKRLDTRYLDVEIEDLDRAIDQALEWKSKGVAKSIGVPVNAVDLLERLIARKVVPDVLTDQTSAHDPLNGYVPNRMTYEAALALRAKDPEAYERASLAAMVDHCRAMLELQRLGADTFDYGNNLRGHAQAAGFAGAFGFEGFVPKYVRPLFCQGKGPFRWAALSGDPRDIAVTDRLVLDLFPDDRPARALDPHGRRARAVPRPSPPASAGSATATAPEPAWPSTKPSRAARSPRRSSSAATTSTAAPSRARTARPKACATARTPSPTGRS